MRRRIVVLVAAAAVLGLLWATRWVVLWEFALAFRPPKAVTLNERMLPKSKLDWRAHVGLAAGGTPPTRYRSNQQYTRWRLDHLRSALETCPKWARPAVRTAQVRCALSGAPRLVTSDTLEAQKAVVLRNLQQPDSQTALTHLRELATAAREADPDNGYFDIALAYDAFARGDRDSAARYLVAASAKQWLDHANTVFEAVAYAAGIAGICPKRDPLFALMAAGCVPLGDLSPIDWLAHGASDTALEYARDGRAPEGRALSKALIGAGRRMRDGALYHFERETAMHVALIGFRTYCESAIRYGTADEGWAVFNEFDAFTRERLAEEPGPYPRLLPFWSRLRVWATGLSIHVQHAVSLLHFAPVLLLIIFVSRLLGASPAPGRFISPWLVALMVCAGLIPPLAKLLSPFAWDDHAGPYLWVRPDPQFYGEPLKQDLTWGVLLVLMLFAAIVTARGFPLAAARSWGARIFLAGCVVFGVFGALVALWRSLSIRDFWLCEPWACQGDASIGLWAMSAAGMLVALWAAALLFRGLWGRARLSANGHSAEDYRSGLRLRAVAGRLSWLAVRVLVVCGAIFLLGLLWHTFFSLWIGSDVSEIVRHGDVSLLETGLRI